MNGETMSSSSQRMSRASAALSDFSRETMDRFRLTAAEWEKVLLDKARAMHELVLMGERNGT